MKKLLIISVLFLLSCSVAFAAPISWTDWTSGSQTSASGTVTVDGASVSVDYSGLLSFYQLGSGTNYWTEGDPAPYTGNSIVDNAPTPSELLALDRSHSAHTITFSQAIENPIMSLVSVGRTNLPVTYDFDTPFTLLSEGRGYWGDGTYSISGNSLTGYELHGVVQFQGLVSSISWSNGVSEYWHGFTFGAIADTDSSQVPEPGTLLLLGSGVVGLALYRRRSMNK